MKKRILAFLAVLCLLSALAMPALAADRYVTDETATTLSGSELSALEEQARQVSEEYDCGVYVVVVYNYELINTTSVRQAAQDYFTQNGYGTGSDASGVMLFLSMADRDYAFIAHGYGNTAFTDYGKQKLQKEFLDNFRSDDWYGGMNDFIRLCGEYLERSRSGNPVDIQNRHLGEKLMDEYGILGVAAPIVGIPVIIALIVCMSMRSKMKSVHTATSATFYAVPGSMDLFAATDIFTHTTETRVRIESDSDRGGGGGGGTSIDSGGFSGTSGKF